MKIIREWKWLQHLFGGAAVLLISTILNGHASAELGNTLEQFNNSRFVREFGFVYRQSAATPCLLNALPKYPIAHAYSRGEKPSFSAVVLYTTKDARVIGRQQLGIYYPSNPDKTQREYLVYFVQESTQGAIDAEGLVGKLEAFIADPKSGQPTGHGAERSQQFTNERFIITFQAEFPEPNVRGTQLTIALEDSQQRTPCN